VVLDAGLRAPYMCAIMATLSEPIAPESGATDACAATRGRPRAFDPDRALAAALRLFWQHGYEGTSLTALTEAMGITRPSLYACFGNKEALFRKALDLYEREKLAYVGAALAAPTAHEVAERLLRGVIVNLCNGNDPQGCLGVIATVACGAEAQSIRQEAIARGASAEAALIRRFVRAREEGDLPNEYDPLAMAQYLQTVLQGLSIKAGTGAPRETLERVIEVSLATWPRGAAA